MNKRPKFVIQKHYASHLHFDFRLEMDGIARSWAIPKDLPREEGIKRLAVQVEDHSINYMGFEGEIPEGEYGAGEVEIWDKGYYVPESIKPKKLVFNLHGKKLKGRYTLLNFKGKNWLLFKAKEIIPHR